MGMQVSYWDNEGNRCPRGAEDLGTTGTTDRTEPANQHNISEGSWQELRAGGGTDETNKGHDSLARGFHRGQKGLEMFFILLKKKKVMNMS